MTTTMPQHSSESLDDHAALTAHRVPPYRGVFPNSTKAYLEGPHGVRVPMREIALSGGEPPLRVYDTSGPEGFDVRDGLPPLRPLDGRGDGQEARDECAHEGRAR